MDALTVAVIAAVFTGVTGFIASMVNLFIGMRKQKAEDKKNKVDEQVGISASANNLVNSANTLSDLQEKIYDKSLNEYREQVIKLQKSVLELQGQAEENRKMLEEQKLDIALLKKTTLEQQALIQEEQKKVGALKEKDKSNCLLIKKLIKGIETLICQMSEEGLVPKWTLEDVDLSVYSFNK